MENVHVVTTEDPNTVVVTYRDKTHKATWEQDDDGLDGELVVEEGSDVNLLRAALMAWTGEDAFDISPSDLSERGGGYWEP